MHPARRKVLESLGNHWTGLTVFVEHPEVPMDNNTAERAERGPVVGRKNYYGSGAVWSGQLAAMLFSLLQTLPVGSEPAAVADGVPDGVRRGGRRAGEDVERFLPWNLSPEQRRGGDLKMRSRRRGQMITTRFVRFRQEECGAQTLQPAWDAAWGIVSMNGSRADFPMLTVECDEVYVVAGHKGKPEEVKKKKQPGRAPSAEG